MKLRIIVLYLECVFKHLSINAGTEMRGKKARKQVKKPSYSISGIPKNF